MISMSSVKLIIIIKISYILMSCNLYYSHPPNFNEAKRCYSYNKNCDEFELSKQFNLDDINNIIHTKDYRLYLPLSVQLAGKDRLYMLWNITQEFNDEPSILFTFINMYYNFNMYESHEDYLDNKIARKHFPGFIDIHHIISRLKELDPNNSIPFYLEAYYYLQKNNKKRAIEMLIVAEEKEEFSIYDTEIMYYSIHATEFVGYPQYLSMDVGLSITVSAVAPAYFIKLARLAIEIDNNIFPRHIYILGERLEKNSFMLISKNFGIYLQRIALFAEGKGNTELENRAKYINELQSNFNMQLVTKNEKQLVDFFQYMIENDEIKAMEKFLNKDKHGKFKK